MTTIIKPSRRGFITGLASLVAAPALVRVSSLMPVKSARAPLTGTEILNKWRMESRLDVLYGRLYVSPDWLNLAAQELIRVIPACYDTRNNDA